MKTISARIVADSINSSTGDRITSFVLTYPRFIHSELMTHRMFSRNSASSRAIPFEKMVKMVQEDPFIPIAWQKDHKGMQGTEYMSEEDVNIAKASWGRGLEYALSSARQLYSTMLYRSGNVTKQICNRLLEPFMWHTVLVTATEWDNFFELRCPNYVGLDGDYHHSKKDWWYYSRLYTGYGSDKIKEPDWFSINRSQTEIHMQALAEAMWDAMNESAPKQLEVNGWHIPFGDQIDENKIEELVCPFPFDYKPGLIFTTKLKIAVARCARLSYMTFDNEIDYEKDIKLHDQLLKSQHMSPFEHCAKAAVNKNYYSNFRGWISYRFQIE